MRTINRHGIRRIRKQSLKKMERENREDNTIYHHYHLHPLKLTDVQEAASFCCGCRRACSGKAYKCNSCDFLLDTTCARLPQKLRHPAHPTHLLTLRFLPNYVSGKFLCDACGHDGDSFCYNCSQCDFDLHLPCAAVPRKLRHKSHPHPLDLVTDYKGPTAVAKYYVCGLCQGELDAASQWFYICRACDFGGHVVCFMSDDVHAPNTIAKGLQTEHANMGQQLLDLQLQLQASMMTADIMVQGARAVANLAPDSGPYQYSYYDAGPLPSQYAAMANSMVMNNLALLSINNTANSRAATEPQSSGTHDEEQLRRSAFKDFGRDQNS